MKSTLNIAAFLIIVSAAQADWVAYGPPQDAASRCSGELRIGSSPGRAGAPRTPPNRPAGLPDANSGRFVSEAIIQDIVDIQVRSALPFNGNPGGLTEYIIPNPNSQLRIIRISGANPEF